MKKLLYFPALFALLATGCTEDADETIVQDSRLVIEAEVEGASSRAAKQGVSFTSGDRISLFALNSTSTALWSSTEMTATLGATGWVISPTLYLGSDNVKVYGYYPSTTITPTIANIQSVAISSGQTDYMYGSGAGDVNGVTTSTRMTFHHALALLTFTFTSSNSPEACVLSNISIADNTGTAKMYTTGTMNIITGEVTPTTAGANTMAVSDGNFKSATKTYSMMVLPTNVTASSVKFTFTIDAKPYSVVVPAINWQSGRKYTYPIKLSGTSLSIGDGNPSDIVITDWTDGGTLSATEFH